MIHNPSCFATPTTVPGSRHCLALRFLFDSVIGGLEHRAQNEIWRDLEGSEIEENVWQRLSLMFTSLNGFNAFQCSQVAVEIEQLIGFVKSHVFNDVQWSLWFSMLPNALKGLLKLNN